MDTNILNEKAARIAELRDIEAELSASKKKITEELEALEMTAINALIEAGLKSYPAPSGMLTVTYRTSVKTPKTPEEKESFYSYLKDKGDYDNLISVNSMKLNSYYKEQMALAIERGDQDFKIPGIEGVTVTPGLSFTKPKR